ncbi:alpha-amylase family protein [Paludibaculum fermentans]|uniref:Beta-galactosidase trimerization domain-containing protein n=1 Tax=Paludibaculum fermentans TaxID=1473598 RepID=A0A7S7NKW0_PALFE|nr:beta-galactosidase trimerization domain-containing protein [Paludibaculum fermentans]QOY85520.1 beta-galactosidase trimerization domain-containing protein [Paludibaculum fermentans]
MNRRDFMQISAGLALPAGAQTPAAGTRAGWYDRPMRWAQLAFVEDDPGQYDQAFWLDYFRRIHADAACLSAGGCVAFYPTKIPLHYRSKWLKDGDAFGDLVKGCRGLGMNIIARTDPHGLHQDLADAHPDYVLVSADGKPRKHWADPDYWVSCALGPYNFDFMTRVTEEIVSLYQVDGIFSNRWAGSGMCYCAHCVRNFRDFSGLDLPRTNNPQDPARRQYIVWKEKRLFDLWHLWDARIKAINPNAAYIANAGGGALSDLDMKTIGELTPTLFADRQARHGLMPPWTNGKNGKEYRAALGRKPIAGIFSVGIEESYRWKDSVQSGDEIRLWMMDGVAQGLRPWFTKFNAKPLDRRWLPVVEELYTWHHRNERYLRNEESLARVGLVYSQQTATFYGGERAHAKVEDHTLGFYQALLEARIPFEMVHDRMLEPAQLARFKTLILPNIAALSTAQCGQVQAFADAGGSIVATHETSLYDEWGKRRDNLGLARLFGASVTGALEGPLQNSYLTLNKDPATGQFHPLLAGMEDAGRIINGTHRVPVRADSGSGLSPLTLVPTYPDLPMESVYVRQAPGKDPGVFLKENGKSRIVYFPWDLDRTFWEVMSLDHGRLLQNAVRWAHNEVQPLTVKGKGLFDLAIWTQKNSMTVHLVNLTNPMMMKGPIREIIPAPPQTVVVRLPPGKTAAAVHLLVAGRTIAHKRTPQGLEIAVPPVGINEVIAIDFAG